MRKQLCNVQEVILENFTVSNTFADENCFFIAHKPLQMLIICFAQKAVLLPLEHDAHDFYFNKIRQLQTAGGVEHRVSSLGWPSEFMGVLDFNH